MRLRASSRLFSERSNEIRSIPAIGKLGACVRAVFGCSPGTTNRTAAERQTLYRGKRKEDTFFPPSRTHGPSRYFRVTRTQLLFTRVFLRASRIIKNPCHKKRTVSAPVTPQRAHTPRRYIHTVPVSAVTNLTVSL